ncbi:MAG TPA: tetratricopeptide repeat protein [Streptosporangiaceae bacterium]|nr:tetratricopeptide repeat protein [Streptosporangiaceae bacterium]
MTANAAAGPVAEFCAALRQLRQASGVRVVVLARQLGLSRTQLYAVFSGQVTRPPDWDGVVRPLIETCTGGDAAALAHWRQRHAVLIQVYEELGRLDRQHVSSPQAFELTADPARRPVPRELPAPVAHFTGRVTELAALTGLLDHAGTQTPGTIVISAIGGTAGVGKTALAVHWAHQVADRFGDGQLYVNLRGYDPGQPVTAANALARFLRALGVAGQDIPADEAERAARYRSQLAGKQILIVLDNAGDVEQVRPLLPGSPGCAVVVTSRDALAGLVARDGAARLDLDLLPLHDAVALLRQLIGERAEMDPAAVEELAAQCCRLPLALRVAAEFAAARPGTPVSDVVAELSDRQRRLERLDAGGDRRTAVRAVFSWSYDHLDADTARAFRLAGLHPGADFGPYAIAALTNTTLDRARHALDALARGHLIQPAPVARHALHDLLRAYARDLAASSDAKLEQHAAMTRLFDYYVAAVAGATHVLYPAGPPQRLRTTPTAVAVPEIPGPADARAWLDDERANLVAVVVHCAGHGWPRHAADLSATLFRYLVSGSHLPEALTICGHALDAARRSGDLAAEAQALNGLGGIGLMRGRLRDAFGHYEEALERFRRCGDRSGEARVLRNLGVVERDLHNHRSAASYCRAAFVAYEDVGDSFGAARALTDLATAEIEMGSFAQASEHLERALPVIREANDQSCEAQVLEGIGHVNLRRGQLTEATTVFEQALAIQRHIDHPAGVAAQLCNLGYISLRQGRHEQAISYLREALAVYREIGDQHGEVNTLSTLAEALHVAGQPPAARAELTAALRLAAETGNTYQQASAHRDLAESYRCAREDEQARHHWQQALDLYTRLGAPEAQQVRSRLGTHR